MVTTVETEQGRQIAESLVKQLTGGDPVRARRMRADFFEFQPSHKLWVAGNYLPRIRGTDNGIWRRIALVPFRVTFDRAHQDRTLPHRLAAEAPGILAWAVAGCLEWQRGGLRIPEAILAATTEYRDQEDHVGRFLAECTVAGATHMVTAKALRARYEAWCDAEAEPPWSAKAVGTELGNRGFDRAKLGRDHVSTWIGLGLIDEEHVDDRLL